LVLETVVTGCRAFYFQSIAAWFASKEEALHHTQQPDLANFCLDICIYQPSRQRNERNYTINRYFVRNYYTAANNNIKFEQES